MRLVAFLFVVFSATLIQSASAVPKTDAERAAAAKTLTWREGESLSLPKSRATLKTPAGIGQLDAKDAATIWEVINGVAAPLGIEAMIDDDKTKAAVYFLKQGDGYVRIDDWNDLDADEMLKSMSEGAEEGNQQRRESGIAPLHIVGWVERPSLDRAKNTVRWAIEVKDDSNQSNVNRVSLTLLRDGFEKLIWVGSKEDKDASLLKIAQDNFKIDDGSGYVDFKPGDKVAEYGIAGLVASVLGVKLAAKLGLLALAGVFLKKFAVLIVLPFMFLFGKAKSYFARKKARPDEPPTS